MGLELSAIGLTARVVSCCGTTSEVGPCSPPPTFGSALGRGAGRAQNLGRGVSGSAQPRRTDIRAESYVDDAAVGDTYIWSRRSRGTIAKLGLRASGVLSACTGDPLPASSARRVESSTGEMPCVRDASLLERVDPHSPDFSWPFGIDDQSRSSVRMPQPLLILSQASLLEPGE